MADFILDELPSTDELVKKYEPYSENPGLKRVRNWALPNCAEDTDEASIDASFQDPEERGFVKRIRDVFRSLDE